jgi:hypothetical protein
MPNPRTQRVASLRRIVAVSTLVVFMAVWGAVVELGPGGGTSSASTTPVSTGSTSSNDTSSQASTPLITSQS